MEGTMWLKACCCSYGNVVRMELLRGFCLKGKCLMWHKKGMVLYGQCCCSDDALLLFAVVI